MIRPTSGLTKIEGGGFTVTPPLYFLLVIQTFDTFFQSPWALLQLFEEKNANLQKFKYLV